MASNNQLSMWIATAWALILSVGLTYYLVHSLRRGVITSPARFISSDTRRDVNPVKFWFAVSFYLIADMFVISVLLYRVYVSLKNAA
jgi:hypothetical protein